MRPKVGVAVFIFKENKILLMHRKSSKKLGNNTWSIPGGHLEMFEEIDVAVRREVFEETNIKIKNLKFLDITNDIYKDINKHYITIFYKAEYFSGIVKNKEPYKCKDIKWIAKEDFPKNVFMPINNLLKKYSLDQIYKK